MIYNAFTCTGPYAILIMLGIKRVENRSVLPVPSEGRCAVSCSKSFSAVEYGNFVQWASRSLPTEDFGRIPAWADVKGWRGMVIGACDYSAFQMLDGPHGGGPLPWDEGYDYWWNLSEVVCFDQPIPCRGNVGMWQMSPDLAARVTAADSLARCEGAKVVVRADAERLFRLAMPIAGGNEGMFVLPLDDSRRALSAPILVALGEPATAVIQPGEIFAAAFGLDAKSIIIAHNHPSGDPTPSEQDKKLTSVIRRLGDVLGLRLADHLVIGAANCVSCMV